MTVNTFSADWLALREPADEAARSTRLTRLLADRLSGRETVHVLDLASGTGANLRYLAQRLGGHQNWLLADNDAVLLDRVPAAVQPWAEDRGLQFADLGESQLLTKGALTCRVRTTRIDLAGSLDETIVAGANLVTASALLDLVSERWLVTLASRCHDAGATVLFALTYDGRIECSPMDRDDDEIRRLVNAHQRRDKGFGEALGPTAPDRAGLILTNAGYHIERDRSDWVLESAKRELQRQLIEGWASAATETAPAQARSIQDWRSRRIAYADAGRSRLIIGHEDILGWV
jgi:hypothetical protein